MLNAIIVVLLAILPAVAQESRIETISVTVDRSDSAVVSWLDSLASRERAARGHLSDSTGVAYVRQVLDGTLGLPDSIDVRMDSLTVIRVARPDSMARPLDLSLIGGVQVFPDSIGGEHWLRLRFTMPTGTTTTAKLIARMIGGAIGVAEREYGAYVLGPTEIRMARAPAKDFLVALAATLAN